MNMIKKLAMIGAVTSAVTMATGAYAGATPEEIAKLGNELTPSGAERAGNADGTIPEWTDIYIISWFAWKFFLRCSPPSWFLEII